MSFISAYCNKLFDSFSPETTVWIHQNPLKTSLISGICAAGAAGVAALAIMYSPLGKSVPMSAASTMIGSALVAGAAVSNFVQNRRMPPHHDMKNHAYREGSYENGALYYEGDVPVLSLDMTDPFKAGKAHGFLCGAAIYKITSEYDLFLHVLGKQPRAGQLPMTLAALKKKIPEKFLIEMAGIAEGCSEWAKQHRVSREITADDILLLNLLPDSKHFSAGRFEKLLNGDQSVGSFGCTALACRDPEKGMVLYRLMDWPSLRILGKYSLLFHRARKDSQRNDTIEVGVPGCVGTITGINSRWLCLAMNVATGTTNEIRGMPASFFNRECLERCQNIEDVELFCKSNHPLGPYHLTVVDKNDAKSIHFYQFYLGGGHTRRKLREDSRLITLNDWYHRENSDGLVLPDGEEDPRRRVLNHFFKNNENPSLAAALSLPKVSHRDTLHNVHMEPKQQKMRVAFDNAYAGNAPLREVPVSKIFAREQNKPGS